MDRTAAVSRETAETTIDLTLDVDGDGDARVDTARQTLSRRREVCERVGDLDQRLFESTDADYRLTRVLDSLSRTAQHGGNVAEFGLRMAVRDGGLTAPVADEGASASGPSAESES
mgnify:CR=1 FL=1